MEGEATLYPDAPWRQDRGVPEGRPQRRASALKVVVQGFEGRVTIPPWAVFISGVVVGATVALYVACSKS